jgi:hypothetical protein
MGDASHRCLRVHCSRRMALALGLREVGEGTAAQIVSGQLTNLALVRDDTWRSWCWELVADDVPSWAHWEG